MPSTPAPSPAAQKPQIWWSNAIFFVSFHVMALYGMLVWAPWSTLCWKTTALWFASWQFASFGITLGYHRLWSHRAYEAALPFRVVLAVIGSLGFQGSIRWWALRHRLHHRFTDDPVHDPYSATRGLFYAHCGWIFLKPKYERMKTIDRDDLDADPVVRFQHKHYIPLALFFGLVCPTLIGATWGDALGGYVWGGLVARLFIWHTTFCINSLAHWTGLQPYTEEITARGNYFLALLTSGEGNHNYHHAFPSDYKNGPHPMDWDPTKNIIWILHRFLPSLVPSVVETPEADVLRARARILQDQADALLAGLPHTHHHFAPKKGDLPVWGWEEVRRRVGSDDEPSGEANNRETSTSTRKDYVVIEGWVVDVSGYLKDHPGGANLLRSYAIPPLPPSASALASTSSSPPISSSASSSSSFSSFASRPASCASDSGIATSVTSSSDDLPSSRRRATAEFKVAAIPTPAAAPPPTASTKSWRKDATAAFNGGVNRHSRNAKDIVKSRRVARLQEEG